MQGHHRDGLMMQERSERTRRRLVEAAAEMIDRFGYPQANLGDISRAAGVTKGALYFHFPSKAELALAVQQRGCRQLDDMITGLCWLEPSPLQNLIDTAHALANWLCRDRVVRASFRLGRERTAAEPVFVNYHMVCVTTTWALMRRACAERALRDEVPPKSMEMLLSAALAGVESAARSGMPYEELAERLAGMWDLILRALAREEIIGTLRTSAPDAWEKAVPSAPGLGSRPQP
ncbi:ScbR family autoregulator-binding transcription factor [Streptomyces iconiensis]|uniref:ScbR family autoregulator-binding transcription factor n=1 Tax=Streptomyces iconiensis TaxID=1384038 RepID=A0ABT7A0W9_9ACTN|nr:ScbR family autoregulator-binding transcription factor [Streptomyces iconiensis]MDJ1134974.1 ScbR family autoregulator-binding transcription factor [Streptomyces iconiensis]